MGALATALAYGLGAMIGVQGSPIVYRKVTTLVGANPAPNPLNAENLVVDGATLAGASSIDFRGSILTGRLLAGDSFMLPGDPTSYVVNAPAISPTTSDSLTGVTFAPTLLNAAADGTAVTLAFAADSALNALITDIPVRLIADTTTQQATHQIRFLASALPVVPAIGDQVFFFGIEHATVLSFKHMETQGVRYAWSVQVRA